MSDDSRPGSDAQLEAPGSRPPSCTSELCMTAACADGEREDIAQGCRFYAAQLDNVDSDDGKSMMLVLTNSDPKTPVNFRVEVRSPDGWSLVVPQDVVPAGQAARVEVNRPLLSNGYSQGGAIRITTDSPILVSQIISDDADRMSTSSSGTVLLPAQALDRHYMAMTFSQVASDEVEAMPGSRDGAGVIAIVGTADRTMVQVAPKVTALVDRGVFYPGTSGLDYPFTLQEGDVLQIFSYQAGGDLSGTTIDADHPVAVFSGNVFTTYGNPVAGFDGGDMAVEQMPPLSTWSSEYVGARFSPQDGCDTFLQPGGGMWQVLAAQDGTRVSIAASAGTVVNIGDKSSAAAPAGNGFTLDGGQSRLFTTSIDPAWPATAPPPTGDIVVTAAGGPILLAQWLDCEPGLSLATDTRFATRTDLTIAFPPGFDQQLVITRRMGLPVQFDGYTIPDDFFQRVSTDFPYEVARLTQDQFGACQGQADRGCQHTITSPLYGVGLGWRGVDIVCSYALTVPPSNPCVQPMLAGCVD